MKLRMTAKVNQNPKHNNNDGTYPIKTAVVLIPACLSASMSGTAEKRCMAEVHMNAAKSGIGGGMKKRS